MHLELVLAGMFGRFVIYIKLMVNEYKMYTYLNQFSLPGRLVLLVAITKMYDCES